MIRTSVLLLLSLFVYTGCQQNQPPSYEESTTEEPATIPVVRVTITSDTYDAPDSLPAGYVEVQMSNQTEEMHSAHLIHLDEGYTSDQLLSAYADSSRTRGTRPEWMTHRGGPLGEPGESSLTMKLEPGNYVWVCVMGPDTIPHFTGHENQPLIVSGDPNSEVQLDDPDVTIRMTDENHELSVPISAGEQSIEIINTGNNYHLAAIAKLNEGSNAEDYMNWFTQPNGPPPAIGVAATSAIGPGLSARMNLSLDSGNYVLFCFANAGGVPHMFQGAIQTVSVE